MSQQLISSRTRTSAHNELTCEQQFDEFDLLRRDPAAVEHQAEKRRRTVHVLVRRDAASPRQQSEIRAVLFLVLSKEQ